MLILILILSLSVNIVLILIARAQYIKSNKYESMIVEFGDDVLETFINLKKLDDRQIFEKDDEVGVVFSDMVSLIEKFNDRTQDRTAK